MSGNANVLIVEDEVYWSDFLQLAVKKAGYSVAGVANTVEHAISMLHSADFDIALVDISLGGKKSGIDIGKLINTICNKPFIFITSDDSESILEAVVAAGPAAYLSKPVSANSLFVTISNALSSKEDNKEQDTPTRNGSSFFVKHGNSFKKINWSDVVCLSVSQNYTQVITRNSTTVFLIRSTLQKTISDIVPGDLQSDFLRINRAQVINATHIDELNGNTIITASGAFDVTDTHMPPVKKYLHLVS